MKKLLLIAMLLSLVSASTAVQAQNLSKAQKKENKRLEKEREKKRQAALDLVLYDKALWAIENNQWAFESDRLTDANGRPVNLPNNRPNVAGFDGKRFFAEILYIHDFRGEQIVTGYLFDSNGKKDASKIDKKGNHVYKFISYPPTPCEATLTLYKDSNRASLTISGPLTVNYMGKIINVKDSWWFMTYEEKQKKR